MDRKNILALAVLGLVLLSGCQTVESKQEMAGGDKMSSAVKDFQVTQVENSKAGAEKAIAAAEKARKKAASISGEWRDTAKFIKKARAALKDGKVKKAIKLANKAELEGIAGYEQAHSQRTFRVPAYLQYK